MRNLLSVLSLILLIAMSGCGGSSSDSSSDDSSTVSVDGYWELYHTEGSYTKGPDYFYLTASSGVVTGYWGCGSTDVITGTLSGSTLAISWDAGSDGTFTLSGTVSGTSMSGTYGGDTWWATAQDAAPTKAECAASITEVVCYNHDGTYAIEAWVESYPAEVSSVFVSGPGISGFSLSYDAGDDEFWGMESVGSTQPSLPQTYAVDIAFTDSTSITVYDDVDHCSVED